MVSKVRWLVYVWNNCTKIEDYFIRMGLCNVEENVTAPLKTAASAIERTLDVDKEKDSDQRVARGRCRQFRVTNWPNFVFIFWLSETLSGTSKVLGNIVKSNFSRTFYSSLSKKSNDEKKKNKRNNGKLEKRVEICLLGITTKRERLFTLCFIFLLDNSRSLQTWSLRETKNYWAARIFIQFYCPRTTRKEKINNEINLNEVWS